MILDEILELLKNDIELKELLKPTMKDSKIHMFSATQGINYKWVQLTSDGIKTQSRLEITAIHADFETATKIVERVKKILLTIGDTPLSSRVLSIAQNGGGCLENPDTHDINLLCFFIVKSKE
ncbi:MAG: hypothetical protein AB9856_20870 [Cellulosilyticaceae bacterium]